MPDGVPDDSNPVSTADNCARARPESEVLPREVMLRYAPRARRIEELTDEDLAMIGEARVSAEHDHLNALLDD